MSAPGRSPRIERDALLAYKARDDQERQPPSTNSPAKPYRRDRVEFELKLKAKSRNRFELESDFD